MMWAIGDLARFDLERETVSSLSASVDWLTVVRWYVSDAKLLCIDADLQIGAVVRKVTLRYPEMFPYAPPSVVPREAGGRWSSHQYGPNGELCLAYRPDNWVSTVTGADMLSSAYELLATEGGVGTADARPHAVPSAHQTTLGQRLRAETWRLILTATTQDALRKLESIKFGTARFRFVEKTAVGWLISLGAGESPIAESGFSIELSSMLPEIRASIVPRADPGPVLDGDSAKDARAIRAALLGDNAPPDEQTDEILLLVTPSGLRVIYLWLEAGHNSVWEVAVVPLCEEQSRQDVEAARLAEKRIAVVGCGSLGSKVASMLARAGVRNFVLVDDDIFLPENLVRHELNWESVGVHKVDALAHQLKLLGATDVTVRRQQLGGQESGGSLQGVMNLLNECSLIVEASANDLALSYVSKIAERTEKPVVWGKILGGGFGGEIARVRPGVEPTAEVARYRISKWCDAQDVAPPSITNRYESGETDTPMIAYDADVSAIAAQVARMVIDTALGRTPSAFESSAYMIGLRKEWIFVAAFDTWPIDLGGPVETTEEAPLSEDRLRAAVSDLLQIVNNPS